MLDYKSKPRYKLYKFKALVSDRDRFIDRHMDEYLRYLFGDTEEITLWRIKKLQDILVIGRKKK